jgi:lambda repressor-like predicted transcriptional regulator
MSPDPAVSPVRLAREKMRTPDGNPWRLEDLAVASGRSVGLLSMVEHGYVPHTRSRLRIADAVESTPRELWPDEYPEEQT